MILACMELSWQTMLLGFEAQSVVNLRLKRLIAGGPAAIMENHRMVVEKVSAVTEAVATLTAGGTFVNVVHGLRARVQANEIRLLSSSAKGCTLRTKNIILPTEKYIQ